MSVKKKQNMAIHPVVVEMFETLTDTFYQSALALLLSQWKNNRKRGIYSQSLQTRFASNTERVSLNKAYGRKEKKRLVYLSSPSGSRGIH